MTDPSKDCKTEKTERCLYMNVTVPDEVRELLDDPSDPEDEVRTRLGAHFYSTGKLGVAKAAAMAGMKRWQFEAWLKEHAIDMPWTDSDLEQELAAVERLAPGTQR